MSFYEELPYPVIIGTGSVLTSGGTQNLVSGQVALVDATTYQALNANASAVTSPKVLVACGSWHTVDSLSKFIGGLTQSIKTQDFLAKDVIAFEKSYPVPLTQDILQIGWDGVNACDSLSFECGRSYYFKVDVSGEDVFRTYSRPLYRYIQLKTDCCSETGDCGTGCSNTTDPTYYAPILANLINNDVELKYFVKAEPVISNYTATSPNYNVYQINVCDNGDVVALANIQAAYPGVSITRVSRLVSVSTYQLTQLTSSGAPANYTPTGSVLLAVCTTCPSGYTEVSGYDYWVVRRPIAGSENFAGGTASFVATAVSDYSAVSGTFLGQDGAVAFIQLAVTVGSSETAVKDDVIQYTHTTDNKCTPPANSSIAWTLFQQQYKGTRVQTLTLPKVCGSQNQLTAVEAFYAGDPTIVSGSIEVLQSGVCADTYQLTQYSQTSVIDDCLSPAPVTFANVTSYQGYIWKNGACLASNTAPAYPAEPVYAGVRIYGAYADTRFGNCSFEPTDYFSQRPLRINVSQVNEDGNPCDQPTKVTRIQYGTVATQTGEYMIRQYLKAASLEAYNAWSSDPRIREVLNQHVLSFIDRTQVYKIFYLVYTIDRFKANWSGSYPNDKFETIIAFPLGVDTSSFESVFGSYFAQVGVYLKDRDIH
jgi:hypothetical protein